jgi:2-methylcitrate dehydratase PrpD
MEMNRKEFLEAMAAAGTATVTAFGAAVADAAQAGAPRVPKKVEGAAIKGSTEALQRFITSASLRDMPPAAVARGKECLIDGFGVILAGSTLPGSSIVRDYVTTITGKREATVLGRETLSMAAAHAALANGAAGHAMDYDDTQLSTTPDRTFGLLTHPTVPALSAALAIAERTHASGSAFLEAFLVGFEVECKIAEAIDPAHYRRGFHSTGTVGTFGAAAAAGKLLKLNATQVHHMLAIASSLSAGIRVNFGSMTKPLHAARASENGVVAAELAARGFTGGDDGLDGQWGFFQVLGGGADLDRLIPVLGRPYSIVSPGVSFKPYPCGSLSHPSLDAMLKVVVDNDLKPDQIKAIRLRAGNNILEPLRYGIARNALEAKFSVPFLMSSIVLWRRAGMREFSDEVVASEAAQRMMSRVRGVFDEKIEAQGYDKIRSVVEVDLVDGRTLVQPSDERYRGGPEKPFTREELHGKFADCAQLVLSEPQVRRALAAIEAVEAMPDVRQLVRAVAP